jgi:hypothetical protein
MKAASSAKKPVSSRAASKTKAAAGRISHDPTSRVEHIATVAYYKAEARGFQPGRELDDWLEAEAELDQ